MVVDGRGVAGRDLRRAGDRTADDEGERTGVERLHGLLRRVDMALGDDLGRALPRELGDKTEVHIVDARRLGRVAAHRRADKVRTGPRAGQRVLNVVAVGHAIVGTGYFGAELGRIMKTKEGAKIVAVYDPENGAAIAAELGCDNESSLESICARPDVDAVIVATPNYLHKEPVLEAARNHKNVFCEKPIALSYADCDEMVNTCKENNVVFMAGHVMNFFHGVRLAKKFIQEGRIGKVLYAHSARNGWEEPQPSISWKKIRSKSGGHLYHHIHELDCIQFIMGPATRVTMTGGNVAHSGPEFGDEDDMLFLNLEFGNNTYAIVEYGSAFHWPEHYVLIQGTKGAIRIDMCNVGMTVKLADGTEEHYCVHANKEIDDDRTRIYHSTEMDGAIQYGHPGKKPPMWLNSIMNAEMEFFNGVMHGDPIPDEFKPLMTGEAARAAIATADAATLSLRENRKVSVEEVMK